MNVERSTDLSMACTTFSAAPSLFRIKSPVAGSAFNSEIRFEDYVGLTVLILRLRIRMIQAYCICVLWSQVFKGYESWLKLQGSGLGVQDFQT